MLPTTRLSRWICDENKEYSCLLAICLEYNKWTPNCLCIVAKRVAARLHTIQGKSIAVELVSKRQPTPVREQCLLLQGIPDDCTTEHLSMLMENASGCEEEPEIQYGEKPGTALCTFKETIQGRAASQGFTRIIDMGGRPCHFFCMGHPRYLSPNLAT